MARGAAVVAQQAFNIRQVAMPVCLGLRAGQAAACEQAGMIQFILENQVLRPGKAGDDTNIERTVPAIRCLFISNLLSRLVMFG